MPEAATIVMAVVSAVSAISSSIQSHKAASAQKAAGQKAAEAERTSTAKQQEDLRKKNAYQESLARARAGASGVRLSGTVSEYLKALNTAGKKDVNWLGKVGASRADAALASGNIGAAASQASAWGSLGAGAANTYSIYKAG